MSKRLVIKPESDLYLKITELEQKMDELGLSIIGYNLRLRLNNGKEYHIGRDSDQFPRGLDEPFWVEQ